jgi:hypothetical protein
MWEFYTPHLQVLEVFDYTDEGWDLAQKVEKRLIRPDLNNPFCLNERCGGNISIAAKSLGGRSAKRGDKVRAGKSGNPEGKARGGAKSGAANGRENVLLARGAMCPKGRKAGAAAQHQIRVRCTKTGRISTPCGLTHYQKANNIDTSCRERI